MSGFALTLTFDDLGVRAMAGRLRTLDDRLDAEVLTPVGMALEATTVERFDTNIGPDGEAWELSFRAKITGGRTLLDKGGLRDSFHFVVEPRRAVEVGSADIRAPVHHFGAIIHAKTGAGLNFTLADGLRVTVDSVEIPARPIVGMSAEDRVTVVDIAEDALRRVAGGAA